MSEPYYRRVGRDGELQIFDSTDGTRSNWTPDIQHGSPPLALLTRMIEDRLAGTPLRLGRLTLDILGAIPVSRVRARSWVERPGRRICLLAAEMTAVDDPRPVARVTAWALAATDTADVVTERHPPLVEGPTQPLPPGWWQMTGYLATIDWRRQLDDPSGAAVFWLSPRARLIDDDEPTPFEKLCLCVDSANGVGAALDLGAFMFMNTDTTVHLHRLPVGEDFALRSRGSIGPDGIGVTSAEVFDRQGFVATCAQTLLVQRRP